MRPGFASLPGEINRNKKKKRINAKYQDHNSCVLQPQLLTGGVGDAPRHVAGVGDGGSQPSDIEEMPLVGDDSEPHWTVEN